MRLTLFNGSPRGKKSNTKILLEHFANGFMISESNQFDVFYLFDTKAVDEHAEAFKTAEHVILAFPLYTDAMPGIVKNFIEGLEPLRGRKENPGIGYIVQSGFPEAIHSRFVEKYLIKLAQRLGCEYKGTVIKGGVEGIQVQPESWTKKLFQSFHQLGVEYAQTGRFSEEIIKKLAKTERMSRAKLAVFKLMQKSGLTNFYWNSQLKKNNAYEKRFARPFEAH
jgi:NAD(P)H-dependent FMN reductase